MTKQLIIGLIGEGKTDYRFLNPIIRRTFEDLAYECKGDIEILDVQDIKVPKNAFIDDMYEASKKAHQKLGILILCIHADADSKSDENIYSKKINPAIDKIINSEEDLCRSVVPIVPVTMTESWMLADKDVFREEIGTALSISSLGLNIKPENITDPKHKIEEVIRIAYSNQPKRRKTLDISELYLPMGQKTSLQKLSNLKSYSKFKQYARSILVRLNYIVEK